MAWRCYMVEYLPACPDFWREANPDNVPIDLSRPKDFPLKFSDLRPGEMWWQDDDLCVKLPSGSEWNIDVGRRIRESGGQVHAAWSRTGNAPNVTANPSINHVGLYHGWLRDGFLTDDCEGRKFA